MREQLSEQVKTAMKGGDKARLSTLRLMQSAIQDRDIANRGQGKGAASDDDILQIFGKMVKQREESAKAFEDGGRPELAAKEREEIAIIRGFMPKQMSDEEVRAACQQVIAELGATGLRDMGRVMAALRENYAGQMDFGKASAVVKALLG
jgi:uncharacterized protein YqeY